MWAIDMPECQSWSLTYYIADMIYAIFFIVGTIVGCCCRNKFMDNLYTLVVLVCIIYNLGSALAGAFYHSNYCFKESKKYTNYDNVMYWNLVYGFGIPLILTGMIIKAMLEYRKEARAHPDCVCYVMIRYGMYSPDTITYTQISSETTYAIVEKNGNLA